MKSLAIRKKKKPKYFVGGLSPSLGGAATMGSAGSGLAVPQMQSFAPTVPFDPSAGAATTSPNAVDGMGAMSSAMGGMGGGLGAIGGAVGSIGDMISAGSTDPTSKRAKAGTAISAIGKGAQMGSALGPWGMLGGAVVGGVVGGVTAKKEAENAMRLKKEADFKDDVATAASSEAILKNYDNQGTGVTSFKQGGIINPFPNRNKGDFFNANMLDAMANGGMIADAEVVDGGNLMPLSEDTVEVQGDNPNAVDDVELQHAFVNDGETIKENMVFTDEWGRNGKKATKKNLSYAKEQKKLASQKSSDPRFSAFNQLIDSKERALFEEQEAWKSPEGQEIMAACRGGKIKREDGGPLPVKSDKTKVASQSPMAIPKGEEKDLPLDLYIELTSTPEQRAREEAERWASLTPEQQKKEKDFEVYEAAREENPQFTGQEASTPNPYITYKSGELKGVYNKGKLDLTGEVQGKTVQDMLGNSASKLGIDAVEFAAAMAQENLTANSLLDNLNTVGTIDSYGVGLDTVGDYKDVIEKKLGKDALKGVDIFEGDNEKKQAVQPGIFTDAQQLIDVAAAVYQHRSEQVDKTAKELGITLSPWEKQYFNYLAYNTQHNAPNAVIKGKPNYKGASNKSLKRMMQKIQTEGGLGLSEEEFHAFADVEGTSEENIFGRSDKGDGQLFYNAGNAFRRIPELKDAYTPDTPFYIKAPSKESNLKGLTEPFDLASTYPKEGRMHGGYTNMNTLSAEHMKAGLTLRKKKKKMVDGGTDPMKRQQGQKWIPGEQAWSSDTRYTTGKMSDENAAILGNLNMAAIDRLTAQPDAPIVNAPYEATATEVQRQPIDSSMVGRSQRGTANLTDPGRNTKPPRNSTASRIDESVVDQPDATGGSPSTLIKDPSGRVYADEADKARQAAVEGADTEFQNALRDAEASGKSTFMFNGKPYAAGTGKPVAGGGPKVQGIPIGVGTYSPDPNAFNALDKAAMDLEIDTGVDEAVMTGLDTTTTGESGGAGKKGFQFDTSKLGDMIGYGADLAGMLTRLPSPESPSMQRGVRLERMDNKEELARIGRASRGLDRSIAEGTAQAGAATAARGNTLAKRLQAENQSFANLNKANIGIANTEAGINAQIDATNRRRLDSFNQERLGKQLKEKEIRRQSLANMTGRYETRRSEDAMRALDRDRMELLAGTYASGTGNRAYINALQEEYRQPEKSTGKYGGLIKRKRKRARA